jgi:hypothetical protein
MKRIAAEHDSVDGNRRSFTSPTPLLVWASIAAYIACTIWIDVFEPTNPTLTVEAEQSWAAMLIGAAAIAGTILGIRVLWGLYAFFGAAVVAFSVGTLFNDVHVQSVGASILSVVSLGLILLPSVMRFESRRLRLMIEDADDPHAQRPVPSGLLLGVFALVVLLSIVIGVD